MTTREWDAVVAVFTANWPHNLPPEMALEKWFHDLEHLPAETVLASVEALYRDGREFPPNGAQILAKASELERSDPDWSRAWELANEAALRFGFHREHRQTEAIEWLRERSPAAAETVRRFGHDSFALRQIDNEGTDRAQFRQIFEAVVRERRREDTYAVLPGLSTKEVRGGPPRRIGEIVSGITGS